MSLPVGSNWGLAKQIVNFIEEQRRLGISGNQAQSEPPELWKPVQGIARTFPLNHGTLEVPGNMDIFNTYRLRFWDLAFKYAGNFEKEYYSKVHGFETFMVFFPKNFHLALDEYETMWNSVALTMEANQQRTASVMSFVPNLVGGGFGLKGALKGIAGATAFNLVRDGVESSAMKNALNVKPAQQQELYGRINPKLLIENVFADYWRVFLSLVVTLNQNERDIWWPSEAITQQAGNIFQNLSNPNFPQEKVLGAMIGLLEINPYNAEYYKFIIARFGETAEVAAIKNYFGYTDLNNPRMR